MYMVPVHFLTDKVSLLVAHEEIARPVDQVAILTISQV